MEQEKRSEGNQTPEHLNEVLNEMQLLTLKKMESYGWMLAFIRRPLFQEVTAVMRHHDTRKYGTLDTDGSLDVQPNIKFR